MSNSVTIGKRDDGHAVKMDVARLLVTRLLITADSGGGKSYLLRKILEQVSRTTQTIVFDPEGEFSSLREIRDMVLAGPGGEVPAEHTRIVAVVWHHHEKGADRGDGIIVPAVAVVTISA